jgi:hypothetical protein
MAYLQGTEKPSREKIAADLNALADKVASDIDTKALDTFQDLVPKVYAAAHNAVRNIIFITNPRVQAQTTKVFVKMLELEIADHQRMIRELKGQPWYPR